MTSYVKTASEGYITIKRVDHFGEKAIPTGKKDKEQAEFILIDCEHYQTRVWLRREDIS